MNSKYLTLGREISYVKGKAPKDIQSNDNYIYLSPDYLRGNSGPEYITSNLGLIEIVDNDIILLWDGSNAGEFFLGKVGYLSSTMVVIKFDETNIDRFYLYYTLKSYQAHLKELTAGTGIPHVDKGILKKYKIPNVILPEQKAIAHYLTTVDKAIQATKNSIAKLEALKTSLMQNLLTGKMKPDGTWRKDNEFWIHPKFGQVPIGWEVRCLGDSHIALIDPIYEYEVGFEYPFLEMAAVQNNYKGIIEYSNLKIDKRNSGFACFKNGDILYAKITPCVENGKITIINDFNGVGFGSTEFTVISPSNNIESYLLFLLLTDHKIHQKAISLMEGTTGRQRIPKKVFKKSLNIGYPKDKKDQKAIVDIFVNIEKNISSKINKISSLQNLKTSLMQNLLTGKIRIPDHVINQISQNE